MPKLDVKYCNAILPEKNKKYEHLYQVKLIDMNFLQVNKYYHLVKVE